MDVRVRGHPGPEDWRKHISRYDVWSGQGKNGEDEVMANYQENA
jgi:hypothetical protein